MCQHYKANFELESLKTIMAVIKYLSYLKWECEANILLQEFVFHNGFYPPLEMHFSPEKSITFSWEPALWTLNSQSADDGDVNSDFWA